MEEQVSMYKMIQNIASNGAEHAEVIREWLGRSDENKKIYQDLLNIWQVSGKFPERFSTDRQKAWQKVRKQIHVQKNIRRLYQKIVQIAAAIVVVILSIWTGTKLDNPREFGYTEIISPAGQKTHVILPDSSTVLLNGDSVSGTVRILTNTGLLNCREKVILTYGKMYSGNSLSELPN